MHHALYIIDLTQARSLFELSWDSIVEARHYLFSDKEDYWEWLVIKSIDDYIKQQYPKHIGTYPKPERCWGADVFKQKTTDTDVDKAVLYIESTIQQCLVPFIKHLIPSIELKYLIVDRMLIAAKH